MSVKLLALQTSIRAIAGVLVAVRLAPPRFLQLRFLGNEP
jgi:hypothetical protein